MNNNDDDDDCVCVEIVGVIMILNCHEHERHAETRFADELIIGYANVFCMCGGQHMLIIPFKIKETIYISLSLSEHCLMRNMEQSRKLRSPHNRAMDVKIIYKYLYIPLIVLQCNTLNLFCVCV